MRPTSRAFIDVLFIVLFSILLVLVLMHNNPPEEDGAPPPGNIMVEISWPVEMDTDVDLWVKAPGNRPVGYSHASGAIWNLLRDDLGAPGDHTKSNYENAISRGTVDGEYTANVHLYGNRGSTYPVPVDWRAFMYIKNKRIDISGGHVELNRIGEEITLLNFSVEGGIVVPNSIHDTQTPLRAR